MTHTKRLGTAGWLAVTALVVAALVVPASAFACPTPTVTPLCAPDETHYDFTVTLAAHENDYQFSWSFGNAGPWTTIAGHSGDNDLLVTRGTGALYVRWASFTQSVGHATPNDALCTPPSETTSTSTTETTETTDTTATTETTDTTATTETTDTTATTASSETTSSSTTTDATSSTVSSTSTTHTGSVEGATGTPEITPPATDSIGGGNSTSPNGWRIVLLVMAVALSSALLLTPKARRNR